MDLRYIEYAGGNFRSCQPANRPAAPRKESAAPPETEPKNPSPDAIAAAAAEMAKSMNTPAPAAAAPPAPRTAPVPAPAPVPAAAARAPEPPAAAHKPVTAPAIAAIPVVADKFDLVSVDDVHFDADQPEGPAVDVRDLFTSNEIPGAVLVANGAVVATAVTAPRTAPATPPEERSAPAKTETPAVQATPVKSEPSQAELTAQAVARLEERRAREAARHAEREAERRVRKEAALAERRARESADEAEKKSARAAKDARRRARGVARDAARRQRSVARAERRARPAPSPEIRRRRTLIANAASALGLVAAVGATIWYFAAEQGRFERETRISAAAATPTTDAAKPAPAPRLALPRAPQASLLSLAAVESQTERRSFQQVVRVQRGEYFRDLLMRGGVVGADAQMANISLAGVYDVRKMKAGQLVTIDFGILGEEHNRFLGVRFDSNFDRTVAVQRQSRGDFVATEIKKEIITQLLRTNGTIDHSVFQAGLQAGLPPEPVVRMINLFAYDVDFQRDVQKGDTFETLIEQHKDARGDIVRHGNILFASLTLQGQTIKLYRWQGDDGEVDYFSESGHSSKKALMRTPIDGARLSSGFGYRRHPVLGYSKLHQGTDFAAPTGTPIYAAGSGQIERVGWAGGYGNSISIRHNKEYSTLYGHMSGFAPGMVAGKRVQQGDIIGYVGSTGMSTGPHLHYEVHVNNKPIDPLSLKLPSRQRLTGTELARYLDYVKTVNTRFQGLAHSGATGNGIASAETETDTGCVNGARLDPTDKRACEQ
jgi:murein DD-endopeptidase MepM/ murein hydrolase activator NlpD